MLYSRLNALELSTDHKITNILEDLIVEINNTEQIFLECAKYIESDKFRIDQNPPKEIEKISNRNISDINSVKEKLISAMKADLDNI